MVQYRSWCYFRLIGVCTVFMIILFILSFLWPWYTWIRRAGILSGYWNRVTAFVQHVIPAFAWPAIRATKSQIHSFFIHKYCNKIYIGKNISDACTLQKTLKLWIKLLKTLNYSELLMFGSGNITKNKRSKICEPSLGELLS